MMEPQVIEANTNLPFGYNVATERPCPARSAGRKRHEWPNQVHMNFDNPVLVQWSSTVRYCGAINCYDYSNLVTPFKVCSPGSASAIAAIHWFPFSKKRIFRKFTSRCRRAQSEYFRRAISRQNYKEIIGWKTGSKANLTSYSSLRGFIWWVLK